MFYDILLFNPLFRYIQRVSITCFIEHIVNHANIYPMMSLINQIFKTSKLENDLGVAQAVTLSLILQL